MQYHMVCDLNRAEDVETKRSTKCRLRLPCLFSALNMSEYGNVVCSANTMT